jgi:hypothetical protein
MQPGRLSHMESHVLFKSDGHLLDCQVQYFNICAQFSKVCAIRQT